MLHDTCTVIQMALARKLNIWTQTFLWLKIGEDLTITAACKSQTPQSTATKLEALTPLKFPTL